MGFDTNPLRFKWGNGTHCTSTAMRDAVEHLRTVDGVRIPKLSEAAVLGTSGSVTFASILIPGGPKNSPPRYFFSGRAGMAIEPFAEHWGLPLKIHMPGSWEECLEQLRVSIYEKRQPPLILTDTFHLPYLAHYRKGHFPSHTCVLLALDYEEEVAWVAERNFTEKPVALPFSDMKLAMHPVGYPMTTYFRWLSFEPPSDGVAAPPAVAVQRSLRATKAYAAPPAGGGKSVVDLSLDRLLAAAAGWAAAGGQADAKRLATLCESAERVGSGGGNFRRIYAEFCRELPALVGGGGGACGFGGEALRRSSEVCAAASEEAAEAWTALDGVATALLKAYGVDGGGAAAQPALWKKSLDALQVIQKKEQALWACVVQELCHGGPKL